MLEAWWFSFLFCAGAVFLMGLFAEAESFSGAFLSDIVSGVAFLASSFCRLCFSTFHSRCRSHLVESFRSSSLRLLLLLSYMVEGSVVRFSIPVAVFPH